LKADKNFKMPKQIKCVMALSKFKDEQSRNDYKKLMIKASLIESVTRSKGKKEKED
jgi:hypothetical protein